MGLLLESPAYAEAARLTSRQLRNPRSRTPYGAAWTLGFATGAFGAAIYYDLTDQCDIDNNCKRLNDEIAKLRNELARRRGQLLDDPLGLPIQGPNSVEGHLHQFSSKQRALRKLLDEALSKGCNIDTPDAWYWATKGY